MPRGKSTKLVRPSLFRFWGNSKEINTYAEKQLRNSAQVTIRGGDRTIDQSVRMRRVARLVQYVIHYPRRSRHRTVPGYRLSPAFAQSTSTGAILLTRIHGRAVSPIPDRCDRARPPTHNCPVSTDSTLMHDARAALPASQSMLSASHQTGTRARVRASDNAWSMGGGAHGRHT